MPLPYHPHLIKEVIKIAKRRNLRKLKIIEILKIISEQGKQDK